MPLASTDRISDGGGVEGEREGITVVERLLAELAADVDQGRIECARPELSVSGTCAGLRQGSSPDGRRRDGSKFKALNCNTASNESGFA